MPFKAEHLAALARSNPRGLADKIKKATEEFDFVVIDTPGNIESAGTQFALVMADVIVVPVRPAAYDLNSTRDTIELLEKVIALNPKVQIRILKVAPERTAINGAIERAIDAIGTPVLTSVVRKFVAFNEMGLTGKPLWLLGRGAERADSDIRTLTDELLAVMTSEGVAA